MPLPHLRNSQAGLNKYDPVHSNIFEVTFSIPEAIREQYGSDEALMTEHVMSITGLEKLGDHPGTGQQKFMGTDRSYVMPRLDNTHAEIEVKFSLNLRDDTDNYIYKILRAWAALGYDINTGARSLKREYCADWLKIAVANRAGDIFWNVTFKDVMMNGGLTGLGSEMNYETGEAAELTAKFVSDWWDEQMA